jgi:hypothetical protein
MLETVNSAGIPKSQIEKWKISKGMITLGSFSHEDAASIGTIN